MPEGLPSGAITQKDMIKLIAYINPDVSNDLLMGCDNMDDYLSVGYTESQIHEILERYNADTSVPAHAFIVEVAESDKHYNVIAALLRRISKLEISCREASNRLDEIVENLTFEANNLERLFNKRNIKKK